ncbi:DNRLRE domain-containing protein [Candidatus Formimonas warabiya]|uniref:Carbohydrate-binding module family 96 domain-containing protein n=1 Tax=Formimonas warabiya TaxID=1761012 RepID=A0A3G1KQ15_FORW1|nr:DNRLRE domain-containing protein [Candidatus Formimonas warabiya]ATW24562.1 hypothetical protein DCMF_06985 [Candidatus Formimonas warabiya]
MPTVTLGIPDTTFVSSALADTDFSFSPLIYTGTEPTFQECISLLQVVLPSLPVTAVESALLQLAVIVKNGAAPSPVVVNRVTSPFSTDTVTYHTRPSYTATPSQINVTTSDLFTVVEIDVTTLVNSWLDGTFPNYGIALTNSDGTTAVEFGTDNIVYEDYFPKLVLTYSSTPVEADTAICFSYAQLAHIIEQLVQLYPTSTMAVYTKGFSPSAVTGRPYQLYSSPEGTYGMIFLLNDAGQQYGIPLDAITAIYAGDGTVYNPSITYLTPPAFPPGCDKNLLTALHDYLPVSTDVQLYMGSIISASGTIYKNEIGVVVLSDSNGNTPIFIPVTNIEVIIPLDQSTLQRAAHPLITITNKA